LTVRFCDLVGSTALSAQLDPEDLREVVRQYQQTCAEAIQRHEGYIAQYLGDGLLVYFGYPTAHEDDAQRAVRTGLEIIQALCVQVPSPLAGEGQGKGAALDSTLPPHPTLPPQGGKEKTLQVRIGIHTGLVVIGDIGASGRTEQLALGETPNIAARIEGRAEPNTLLVSAATHRLIEGQFECQSFSPRLIKGIDTPLTVYQVQSERQSASLLMVIPATLQETLLVRLDRLADARQVAQLGATLGREFSYELLHAVAPFSETDLQTALAKPVEAEILYQRGAGSCARQPAWRVCGSSRGREPKLTNCWRMCTTGLPKASILKICKKQRWC